MARRIQSFTRIQPEYMEVLDTIGHEMAAGTWLDPAGFEVGATPYPADPDALLADGTVNFSHVQRRLMAAADSRMAGA